MFTPTRAAALSQLEAFLPDAGLAYAAGRNTDTGPGTRGHVSCLSPWLRTRALGEWEVVGSVLQSHSPQDAAKFIDEVCWRTYWKGWLALRPSIWREYLTDRERALQAFEGKPYYQKAIEGETGIDCFDAWVRELIETGYLHNHARMWLASIWIHTLRLPWELGADFFLRHLLDGDAASNTLSWRWVAGLHTRDKAYLATAGNIRQFTNGRFTVDARLADQPAPLRFVEPPAPQRLDPLSDERPGGKTALLLTDDDLSADRWLTGSHPFDHRIALLPEAAYVAQGISQEVLDFRRASMADRAPDQQFSDVGSLVAGAGAAGIETIVMPEPAVGLWDAPAAELRQALAAANIDLIRRRHWWDSHFYPQATHGFFRFKKAIPAALAQLHPHPPHDA